MTLMLMPFEITSEQKEFFIELIYAGHRANTAAKEIGTTGSRMRSFKNPNSVHYDEWFADQWAKAASSEEHRRNREEHLRAMIDERSEVSDQVLIKRALVELPEWEPLRHTNLRHDVNITVAQKLLPGLTKEQLDQVIEAAERERELEHGELKLLPPAEEDAS